MTTYNVRTSLVVHKNGEPKLYELAFGSGSEKSKDRMTAANCNRIGNLLEQAPHLFVDEDGKALEPIKGGKHTEGWLMAGPVRVHVTAIGAAAAAVETVVLPDGSVITLSQGTATGELPK